MIKQHPSNIQTKLLMPSRAIGVTDTKDLPDLFYPNIYDYIFHARSVYTLEELRPTSLKASNQFGCSMVNDVGYICSVVRVVVVGKGCWN